MADPLPAFHLHWFFSCCLVLLTFEQEVVSWTSADPGANHRGAHDLFRYPLDMLVAGAT